MARGINVLFAEVKRSVSLLDAVGEVNSRGLLHVERQDEMRRLWLLRNSTCGTLGFRKVDMQRLRTGDPNCNAGMEVLVHSKNIKVGKLTENAHTHLESWLWSERKISQIIYFNEISCKGSEICEV